MTQKVTFGTVPPSSVSVTPTDSYVGEAEKQAQAEKTIPDAGAVSRVATPKILKRQLTAESLGSGRITSPPAPSSPIPSPVPDLPKNSTSGTRRKTTFHSLGHNKGGIYGKVTIPAPFLPDSIELVKGKLPKLCLTPEASDSDYPTYGKIPKENDFDVSQLRSFPRSSPSEIHSAVQDLSLSPRGPSAPSFSLNGNDLQTSSEPSISLFRGRSTTTGASSQDEKSPEAAPLRSPRLGDELKLPHRPRGKSEEGLRGHPLAASASQTSARDDVKPGLRSRSNRNLKSKRNLFAKVKKQVIFKAWKDDSYIDSAEFRKRMEENKGRDQIRRESSSIVSNEVVRNKVSAFLLKDSLKKHFSEMAERLSFCIEEFPDEKHPVIIECLVNFHNALPDKKYIRQFNKIIELILAKPEKRSFIYSYLQKTGVSLDDFCRMTLEETFKEEPLKRPQETAERLSLYIDYFPEQYPVIIDCLVSFRNTLSEEKLIRQFNKIIELIFAKPEKRSFIYSYLQKTGVSLDDFCRMTLEETFKEEPLKRPQETAERLSLYIDCFPEQYPVIIDCLVSFRNTLNEEKHIRQFNKIIAFVLVKHENQSFIYSYLRKTESGLDDFAYITLKEIVGEESFSSWILPMVERLTRHDLLAQVNTGVSGTLFRGESLSSSICGKFASLIWKEELNSLGRDVLKELNEKKASTLCLDGNSENIEQFESFARSILTRIFSMPVPDELQQMLTMRRALIADFLHQHSSQESEDLKDLSRPYISEIFFLRLLNPFFIYLKKEASEERKVLISLSKVLQRLANDVAFDEKDSLYVKFNPLLSSVRKEYNTFIDGSSWEE